MRPLIPFGLWIHLAMTALAGPGEAPADPDRWVATDPPKVGSERWFVANHARREWVVTLIDGRPRVSLRDAKSQEDSPLPFRIEPGLARDGLAGRCLGVKVDDGWLVSFNAGEFGAGLWWFSPDGRERYRIVEAHVNAFIPTEAGLLALEGLAHGDPDGQILRLNRNPKGRWTAETFVDLDATPEVAAGAGDGSWMVATTDQLLRLDPAGRRVEVLLDGAFWEGLYPNSMVVTPAGSTYIGMRHGVARVEERHGSWSVLWLLPDKAADRQEIEPGSR